MVTSMDKQKNRIEIEIEDCGKYARCSIPLYGELYGRSTPDILETLDQMSKFGYFNGIFDKIEATINKEVNNDL